MRTNSKIHVDPAQASGWLSAEERAVLGQFASKESPFGQRAQALLALDGGATQAEAGQQAGLTKGQVRYWLTKFRRDGMDMFPQELLDQAKPAAADLPHPPAEQDPSPGAQVAEAAAEAADVAPVETGQLPKAKKSSTKKTKKDKRSGKTSEPTPERKAKKEKKPAKEAKKKVSSGTKGKKSKTGKKKRKK